MFTECLFLTINSDDYNFLSAIISFTVLSTVCFKKMNTNEALKPLQILRDSEQYQTDKVT